jgi:hypothetical protein
MPQVALADTVIFTDTCNTSPVDTLENSTTITVGTSWSAAITLDGTPAAVMDSGTTNCGMNGAADETNDGTGNTMTPVPTTHDYYVDFTWVDSGGVAANGAIGALVNYIDTSNYYACVTNDDISGAVDAYILKMSSGGNSTLASATDIARTLNGDTLECRIDYTGSNPVITFTDITESAELVSATDSSSPLARTERAGVFVGSTPARTNDDMDMQLGLDDIRLVEEDVVAPTVTTQAASSVTASAATLNGTITDTGGATSTVRGFAWGTNSALSGGDTATTTENGNFDLGAFTGSLSSLTGSTQYFFRPYSTNSGDTGFGSIDNFTTDAAPAGEAEPPPRRIVLFEGFTLKFFDGRMILYQD